MLEFNASTVAFIVFALFSLGGALGVVTTRNLIHATLYLILSLFGAAGSNTSKSINDATTTNDEYALAAGAVLSQATGALAKWVALKPAVPAAK